MSDRTAEIRPSWLIMLGPIVGREMLSRMRGIWTYLIFCIPPILQSITLMSILFTGYKGVGTVGRNAADFAFQLIFWIQAVTLGLLLPAISSAAFAHERANHTLTLLAATGLSPARLYRGKFCSLLLYGLLFCSTSLPIWLFSLTELHPSAFWWYLTFIGVFLVMEITQCLFWSALAPTVLTATLLSYATSFWWCVILIIVTSRGPKIGWALDIRMTSALTASVALLFGFMGYRAIKEHGLTD